MKQIVFFVTAGLIKISITLFNRRLTGLTSQNWLYAHNTFLALMITYTLSALFVNALQCKDGVQYDLIKYGKGGGGDGKCIHQATVQNVFIISHVVFDFCLLSVPLIILYKMKTNISKKVRLAFLFSIGSISCIGSAMRLKTKVDANSDKTCKCLQAEPLSQRDLKVSLPLDTRGILHTTQLDNCRHFLCHHRGFAARPQCRYSETLALTSNEQKCTEYSSDWVQQ